VISRAFGWLLIVLAASPFTAPFSTCDVSMLLAASQTAAPTSVSIQQRDSRAVFSASSASPIGCSILDEEQFKDTALTAVATVAPVFVAAAAVVQTASRSSAFRPPFVTLRL
jgi:hypothetical protein